MEAMNSNKMENAQEIIQQLNGAKIKVIKKEDGLIEREKFDDTKLILAEDNRQILLG